MVNIYIIDGHPVLRFNRKRVTARLNREKPEFFNRNEKRSFPVGTARKFSGWTGVSGSRVSVEPENRVLIPDPYP